jgi:hypothetical protein
MKKLTYGLCASILFSLIGNAQAKAKSENKGISNSAYLAITAENETTKYKFSSIEDLEENGTKILDDITLNSSKIKDENCKAAVEISITISNENLSTTITAAVTANYTEIIEEAKKLQNKLILVVKQ